MKVQENRIRRWATRLGFRLYKSRARMIHVNNRGLYQLVDDHNVVVEGVDFDATLELIEHRLREEEARLRP